MDLKAILDKLRSFESNESIEQAIEQVEAMAGEQINEGMTVNKTTSVDDNGQSRETMSITADGDDVRELEELLMMAGMKPAQEMPQQSMPQEMEAELEEEFANEPAEQYGDTEQQLIAQSGGINGPKTQQRIKAAGDNPLAAESAQDKDLADAFMEEFKDFLKDK